MSDALRFVTAGVGDSAAAVSRLREDARLQQLAETAELLAAAVAGGDVVASSEGLNATLVPEFVKCALVHSGFAFAADAVKTQVTEALTLAVKAAMPA